jgi:hypothetical protein
MAGGASRPPRPHRFTLCPAAGARAERFLAGLLNPIERRNGGQLAEQLGDRSPDGVQWLLPRRWDAGGTVETMKQLNKAIETIRSEKSEGRARR